MTEPKTDPQLLAAADRARQQRATPPAEEWETPHLISDPDRTASCPTDSNTSAPTLGALRLEFEALHRQDERADVKAVILGVATIVLLLGDVWALLNVIEHTGGWGVFWRVSAIFPLVLSALALLVSFTTALKGLPDAALFGRADSDDAPDRVDDECRRMDGLAVMDPDTWYSSQLIYNSPDVVQKMTDLAAAVKIINLAVLFALLSGAVVVSRLLVEAFRLLG